MAAGTVGYTDTRGNKDYTSIIASQIGNRLRQASNMASEERAYAAGMAEAGGTSLEEAGIGKGYFFGRALGSRFGGDRIARAKGRMGVGGAGTNPATNYKQRFRGGFDYNVTNQTITDVAPLSNALVVGLRGVQEGLTDVAGAIQRQGTVLNRLSNNQADMAKATMFNGYLFAMFQSQQKQKAGRDSLRREEKSIEGGRISGRGIGGSSFGGAGGGRGMINVTPGGSGGGSGGMGSSPGGTGVDINQAVGSALSSVGLSRLKGGMTIGEKILRGSNLLTSAASGNLRGDVLRAASVASMSKSTGLNSAKFGGKIAKLLGGAELSNLFGELAKSGTGASAMKGVAGAMALQQTGLAGQEAAKILGMGSSSKQLNLFSEIVDANARSAARFDYTNPLFATANRDYDVFKSLRGPDGKPLFTGTQVDIFDQLGLSPGTANVEKYNRMMGKGRNFFGKDIKRLSRMRAAGGSIGNIAEDIAKFYPEIAFNNIDEAIILTQFARLLDTKDFAGKPKKALSALRNIFGSEIVDKVMVSGAETAIKNTKVAAAFAQFGGKGGKGLLKSGALAGKRLPLIGAILGTAFAIDRARKGDFMGAGLEVASGLLGLTPFTTGLGLGIDGFLLARDLGMTPMREGGSIIPSGANVPFNIGGKMFSMNEGPKERMRIERDDDSRHVDAGLGFFEAIKKKKTDFMKFIGGGVFSGIGDAASGGLFENIGGGISNMVEGIKEMFGNLKDGFTDTFNNLKESLASKFNNFKDAVGNKINNVKQWWNKDSSDGSMIDNARFGVKKFLNRTFFGKDDAKNMKEYNPTEGVTYGSLPSDYAQTEAKYFQTGMYTPNVENSGINVAPAVINGATYITNNNYGAAGGGSGADTGDSNVMFDDIGVEYVAGAFNRAML